MLSVIDCAARRLPLTPAGFPRWCDHFLARPGAGDAFASRLWYDTLLGHALPIGAKPEMVLCGPDGAVLVPMLRGADGALRSLSTPYSLAWRPLASPRAGAGVLEASGYAFGRLLRGHPPARLDTLDSEAPSLAPLLDGLRQAGIVARRFDHFGNWWQPVVPGDWGAYLAARPSVLRSTITRKLARAGRECGFELLASAGCGLEAGLRAYEGVRARSWKPPEPFPDFDAALMRAAAAVGALRLGILRDAGGEPIAAQYWLVSGGQASLLKLAYVQEARAASPGTVLTALMIRRLLEEDRVETLDFGRGDDAYKPLWVSERRQRIGLVLADPRHPAGMLALARQAAGQGRRAAMGWIRRARKRQT